MGDRGNIKLNFGENFSPTYFYTHWEGSELPEILRDALIRGRDRWNDEPYLARIIFSEMIQNEVMSKTGYGISPYMCDNERPILVVNLTEGTVEVEDTGKWTFEEFVNQIQ